MAAGVRSEAKQQSIVSDVLDRFQIVAKKDLYPSQLSGGQQQLVDVARAAPLKDSVGLTHARNCLQCRQWPKSSDYLNKSCSWQSSV